MGDRDECDGLDGLAEMWGDGGTGGDMTAVGAGGNGVVGTKRLGRDNTGDVDE